METIKKIPAGVFKAECLAILDDVNITGNEIIVTKYGKPVAKISPIRKTIEEIRKEIKIQIVDDIISPLEPEDWGTLV